MFEKVTRRGRVIGNIIVVGRVVKESCCATKQQYTFIVNSVCTGNGLNHTKSIVAAIIVLKIWIILYAHFLMNMATYLLFDIYYLGILGHLIYLSLVHLCKVPVLQWWNGFKILNESFWYNDLGWQMAYCLCSRYYSLDAYYERQMEKEMKSGFSSRRSRQQNELFSVMKSNAGIILDMLLLLM
jgi:hypothetical protein